MPLLQGQAKARVTRQASRRLLALPKAMEEEELPKALEEEELPKALEEEEFPKALEEEPMEVEELARPATDRWLDAG